MCRCGTLGVTFDDHPSDEEFLRTGEVSKSRTKSSHPLETRSITEMNILKKKKVLQPLPLFSGYRQLLKTAKDV